LNLQKIKKLCLEEGYCLLVEDRHGGQWIGVRSVLFPVTGIRLDEGTLKIIWQLTDKQVNDMTFEETKDFEGVLDVSMVLDEGKVQIVQKENINGFLLMGKEMDDGQVLVVPERLLVPAWIKGEWTRYQLLETQQGYVLAMFSGLMISGVVKPWPDSRTQSLLDSLKRIGEKGLVAVGEAQVWDKEDSV
jgi:hypothetical protein